MAVDKPEITPHNQLIDSSNTMYGAADRAKNIAAGIAEDSPKSEAMKEFELEQAKIELGAVLDLMKKHGGYPKDPEEKEEFEGVLKRMHFISETADDPEMETLSKIGHYKGVVGQVDPKADKLIHQSWIDAGCATQLVIGGVLSSNLKFIQRATAAQLEEFDKILQSLTLTDQEKDWLHKKAALRKEEINQASTLEFRIANGSLTELLDINNNAVERLPKEQRDAVYQAISRRLDELEGKHEDQAELPSDTILAAQLVYSRKPQRQSPLLFEGRRAHHWTEIGENSLSQRDVGDIEAHLAGTGTFKSLDKPPVWRFFPMDGNRICFSRLSATEEHDRSGETFLGMAHSLVVGVDDLTKLPNGILSLWNDSLYVTKEEELEGLSKDKVNIPPLRIDISSLGSQEVADDVVGRLMATADKLGEKPNIDLSMKELFQEDKSFTERVVKAMINRDLMDKNKAFIELYAEPDNSKDIERALKIIIQAAQQIPGVDLANLSFSTNIPEDFHPLDQMYWALGTTSRIKSIGPNRCIFVNASTFLDELGYH